MLIVFACLIFIGLIVAGVIYWRRKKQQSRGLVIPEDHDEKEVTITEDIDDPLLAGGSK